MIVLFIATFFYLTLVSIEDLREKEIHTFPADVLALIWTLSAFFERPADWSSYVIYMAAVLGLYFMFNKFCIWGEGDSDLMLLYAAVYLKAYGGSLAQGTTAIEFLMIELILFIFALVAAALIGMIEASVRGQKINQKTAIALAPGFAMVIAVVMIKGVFLC